MISKLRAPSGPALIFGAVKGTAEANEEGEDCHISKDPGTYKTVERSDANFHYTGCKL
jgi:hypothetical protein